jgi:hypothetical protein
MSFKQMLFEQMSLEQISLKFLPFEQMSLVAKFNGTNAVRALASTKV